MTTPSPRHGQCGFSLVELMVAMTIGLVLLAGIYQVFISTTLSYSFNQQMARMQESGRFGIDLLTRIVRGSGYGGCQKNLSAVTNLLNDPTAFQNDFRIPVSGFDASGSAWVPADPVATLGLDGSVEPLPLAGSDILSLREVDSSMTLLIAEKSTATDAELKIAPGITGINKGDILMVSDCSNSVVFQVSDFQEKTGFGHIIHNTGEIKDDDGNPIPPGNSDHKFGADFDALSDLVRFRSLTFYVAPNDLDQPALFRKSGSEPAEEMVEGVENMQVRYGYDSNGDGAVESYETAAFISGVADGWMQVMSVRIGLLVRSPGEIPQGRLDTRSYNVDGDPDTGVAGREYVLAAADRRLRRVFSATIGLRNKLP